MKVLTTNEMAGMRRGQRCPVHLSAASTAVGTGLILSASEGASILSWSTFVSILSKACEKGRPVSFPSETKGKWSVPDCRD